jgi:hypothetical protein
MRSDNKTIEDFVTWLRNNFPRLTFSIKKPPQELFPEPKKYKGFWKHQWAHANISVFRHGELVAVIEPGGYQHTTDKKQKERDRKKRSICEEFGVSFLPLMNQALRFRELKQFKRLLKNLFYRKE